MVVPWKHLERRAEARRQRLGFGDVAELVVVAEVDRQPRVPFPSQGRGVLLHEVEDADGGRDEGDTLDRSFEGGGAQAYPGAERVAGDGELRLRETSSKEPERGACVERLPSAIVVRPAALPYPAVVEAQRRDPLALLREHLAERDDHRAVHRASVERMRMEQEYRAIRRGLSAHARLDRGLAREPVDHHRDLARKRDGRRHHRLRRRRRKIVSSRHGGRLRLVSPSRARRCGRRRLRARRLRPSSDRARCAASPRRSLPRSSCRRRSRAPGCR